MQNAELFWGVRGAGSTLGVVTSFEFDLVPISTVLAGFVAYPLEHGAATGHGVSHVDRQRP